MTCSILYNIVIYMLFGVIFGFYYEVLEISGLVNSNKKNDNMLGLLVTWAVLWPLLSIVTAFKIKWSMIFQKVMSYLESFF